MKIKIPNILIILWLTLLTAVMWLGFSIYKSFSKKPETKVNEATIVDIDPKLDTQTIQDINSRSFVENIDINIQPSLGANNKNKQQTQAPLATPQAIVESTAEPSTSPSSQPTQTP